MNKYVMSAIGIGAFIVGGIVAREQAMTTVEVLEKKFHNKDKPAQTPIAE